MRDGFNTSDESKAFKGSIIPNYFVFIEPLLGRASSPQLPDSGWKPGCNAMRSFMDDHDDSLISQQWDNALAERLTILSRRPINTSRLARRINAAIGSELPFLHEGKKDTRGRRGCVTRDQELVMKTVS